jgi:hypothetical protein
MVPRSTPRSRQSFCRGQWLRGTPAKKGTQKSAKSSAVIGTASKGFTDDERLATKDRARELKAEARRRCDRESRHPSAETGPTTIGSSKDDGRIPPPNTKPTTTVT